MKNQVNFENILACYRCGSKLRILESGWSCSRCGGKWPIDRDGVVRLSDSSKFFGADQQGMDKLVEEMRGMSAEEFYESIERLEEQYRDFEYDYCLNPSRADWTILGDFKDKVVVDLGCGYGTVSNHLSSRAKSVIGVDVALERIKFFSLVARFRQTTNVMPIHGNVFDLPFREGTIDAFICIGLMEYAGTWKEDVKPSEVQREWLEHLSRYLTEKGEIWIGIENRLDLAYLIGKTHHGDLPFTALMPRILANAVSYLLKGESYRIWTHSLHGYRKLLKLAGFKIDELFYPFPQYQTPRLIVSSGQRKLFNCMLKNPGFGRNASLTVKTGMNIYRILDWMGLLGVFVPAFLIKGVKES